MKTIITVAPARMASAVGSFIDGDSWCSGAGGVPGSPGCPRSV